MHFPLHRRIRYCKACAAILNELASKIVVHIPVKENEKKQVRMDLHFAYVGQIRISFKIGREPLNESEPACQVTPVPAPNFLLPYGTCLTAGAALVIQA